MRVIQVITSAQWGGAQRHVFDLARGIRDAGHEVSVWYGVPGALADRLETAGIPARRVPDLERTIRPTKDGLALFTLRRQLLAAAPDIVHVHSSKAGALVRMALRGSRVPVVYTVHGLVYQNVRLSPAKRALYRWVEQSLQPYASAIITVSKRDYEELLKTAGARKARLFYIPNTVEPPKEPVPWPEKKVIGTIARLTPEKALDLLIDAFAELIASGEDAELLIVGDGPERQKLEAQVARENLQEVVQFVGWQDDVWHWLGKMRVFAMPSVKEGMPYALLEAKAAARELVVADVGGIPDAVGGYDRAILVREHSATRWRDALAQAVRMEGSASAPSVHPPAASKVIDVYARAGS